MKNIILILFLLISISVNATVYYVSSTGSDAANGTSDTTPWQTLSKVSASAFVAGDQILFKRGDTFYGTLLINESGDSGNVITVGAYDTGLDPIITGFTDVSTWTNLGSNIWESTNAVSTLSDLNTVAINGVNTGMGRTPNTGYYYYQSHSGTTISSNNLTGFNWTGAECALNNVPYTVKRFNITSASGTALWLSADPGIIWNNQQFIIQNDARTLDLQNEWYYNPTTKKIRIYSTSQPTNVKVTTVENLVTINGSYVTVDNISITGANSKAISVGGYNYVTIQNCDIRYASKSGVYGSYTSSVGLKVEGCTFTDSNNTAIGLTSYFTNIIIRSNTITNSGVIYGASPKVFIDDNAQSCTALSMWGASGLIELNIISGSGYNGIRFYGNNTIVQNNYITNFCTHSHDGGGIYTWNNGNVANTGMKILNNVVIGNSANGVSSDNDYDGGIYLDDYSNGIEVSGNTVSGNDFGIFLHSAHEVIVSGNTAFNNDKGIRIYGQSSPFYMNNITVQNNTIIAKQSAQNAMHIDPMSQVLPTFVASNNMYARPINDGTIVGGYNRTPSFSSAFYTVPNWITFTGKEVGSVASPFTVTSSDELFLAYNPTNATASVPLTAAYKETDGTAHTTGSISLAAYSSKVLFYTGQITGEDTPPVVTNFSIPATSDTLYVAITTFTATDDVGVTGYLLTESSIPPLSSNPSWSASAPTSYTFTSYGSRTLWAWTKDVSGNISSPTSRTVSIYPQYLIPSKKIYRNIRTGIIYNRNNTRQQ